jgi:hypothetical protein
VLKGIGPCYILDSNIECWKDNLQLPKAYIIASKCSLLLYNVNRSVQLKLASKLSQTYQCKLDWLQNYN